MKVTRNTPDQLIIEHVPWFFAIVLSCCFLIFFGIGLVALFAADDWGMVFFGLMFGVLGGGLWFLMLVLFVKRLQFIFDRTRDLIVIRRRSLIGHKEDTMALSGLTHTELQSMQSSNGSTLYRPALVFDGRSAKREALHSYYTNGRGPKIVADAVNEWLAAKG